MRSISVVIPVYNAEKTIESLCRTLIGLYGEQSNLEIVLVNDNSRDCSDLVCRRLHESFPGIITYIRLSRNFTEHNAVLAGLNYARGEFCVVMDDDFQNPPEEVGLLVDEISKGYDVVYAQYEVKRDSLFRNLGSMANDRLANLILRKPADLYLSSFKIMNRFLVNEIVKYKGPDPYIDAIILRVTDNIGKVLTRHEERRHGASGYTLKKLISLWGNMVISHSLIPLRILGVIGAVLAVYGAFMGLQVLIDVMSPDVKLSDIETLTSVTAFFRGFQLLAISVVGEYIGRIYLSLNSDPQFVIREKFQASRKSGIRTIAKAYLTDENHKTTNIQG